MNSPVRLGFSPTTATLTGFFQSEILRLYFPMLEPWVAQSKTLVFRMLTDLVDYGHKIEEKV